MSDDRELEKLLFELVKKQYVSCSKNDCAKCYINNMGSCSSALTASEMFVALQNAGYGNIKQAVIEILNQFSQFRALSSNFSKTWYQVADEFRVEVDE